MTSERLRTGMSALRYGGSVKMHSNDHAASRAFAFGVGVGGECAGPGDVAMAGWIEIIACFTENPASALITFSEGKVVRSDILFAGGETFLSDRELVHKREAHVVLFAGEVNSHEGSSEMRRSFAACPPGGWGAA